MKLGERLKQADERVGRRPADEDKPGDPYSGLKARAQEALFVKLGPRL